MSTLQNLDPDWTLERLLASKVWLNALLSSASPKVVNVVPSYLVTDGDIQRGNQASTSYTSLSSPGGSGIQVSTGI